MKQFVMQSVHAEEVVVQMMKMYGDFGKFTNNGGNVFYESNIGKKIQGELWAEINVYASGYHAAIDDLAALRAERDELLTLILHLDEKSPCARCVNGKDENSDACEFCGGYGFHPAGDIREHIIDADAVLAKYAGKEE